MNGAVRQLIVYIAGGLGLVAITLFIGWWQVDGPGRAIDPYSVASQSLPLPFYEMNFQLTDHSGRTHPKDWIGRPTLVFFGFTYCPDVCPTTLSNISGWLEELGDKTSPIQAVFITVDPERDTVQVMADYVSNFHTAITGYSGSAGQTLKAAESFRVTYERVTVDESYTMNHSASVFVYNANGEFVTTIDQHEPPGVAVQKIRRVL
ncbi:MULTISPECIES: SCO family protein [unclassified Hwanghaeella]|jgi:protein SCO1/2|uniref:SCO family protein n=1 Tax=unclassified Hwanghaeella TaxID=2605944 RepID=UPI000C0907AD|nr:electron transport protein SCO1/SenC [Gimesia sp.]MAO92725.1 electron transport protein SCO1/SenC [Rhodospirillales bacterium]MAY54908.1 electron transport protein SCO1/SenC [Gammaproteobacteria bacterium]|tara:strand:+ start:4215 stop:4832 length:618 start_codon:yes stop_codon:yes gene_type:complete